MRTTKRYDKKATPRPCEFCGKSFSPFVYQLRIGSGRFCSRHCKDAGMKKPDAERFWSKVSKTDGCWLWTGGKTRAGYGGFHTGQKPQKGHLAHRYSWILTHGRIPEGLVICHRCDNPSCVRPDHLFLGTHADNMLDCISKGRTAKGTKVSTAKLEEADVRLIRKRYANGDIAQRTLAREFGVSQALISEIVLKKIWRHLL